MKITLLLSLVLATDAFTAPFGVRTSSILQAEGGSKKINTKVDLDAPKVVTQEKLEAGDKKVYCRCWKSATFPLCDAAHVKVR